MSDLDNFGRVEASTDEEVLERGSHILRPPQGGGRNLVAEVEGVKLKRGSTWFRGDVTNFLPNKKMMRAHDAIQKFILAGLTPKEPFIDANTRITAFGSCFADNISKYLNAQHYNVLTKKDIKAYVVKYGEGMVHSYAIRQQFEWALEGTTVNAELWHSKDKTAQDASEEVRENTRKLFMDTDLFILTFGLSEVWYSKETGDVFWMGVPEKMFDPEKHGFRTVTADENRENIQATYDLIRKHRPDAKIVFTLSPVPLIASFRTMPCFIANSVSKASLRIAIDAVLNANSSDKNFFYWPAYEIVTDFFPDPWADDRRHPASSVLNHIMRLFDEFYCIPVEGKKRTPLIQTLTGAYMRGDFFTQKIRHALRHKKYDVIEAAAVEAEENDQAEMAELLRLAVRGYDPKWRGGLSSK